MTDIYKKILGIIDEITKIKNPNPISRVGGLEDDIRNFYLKRIKYNIRYLSLYLESIGEVSDVELICVEINNQSNMILFSEWRLLNDIERTKYMTTNWISSDIDSKMKDKLDKYLGSYTFK